jgi:hypothetical protein
VTYTITPTDDFDHTASVYVYDNNAVGPDSRTVRVWAEDDGGNVVSDTEVTVDDFRGGKYVNFSFTGKVKIVVANVAGPNAVASGIFFNSTQVPDKTALQAAVDIVSALGDVSDVFTSDSTGALAAAFEGARRVLDDDGAGRKAVGDAVAALADALTGLEADPDSVYAQAAAEAAAETARKLAEQQAEIELGKALGDAETQKQLELDAAELKRQTDLAAADTQKRFELEAAETQKQIELAAAEIAKQNALAAADADKAASLIALELAGAKAALSDQVNSVVALSVSGYTPESFKRLSDAISNASKVLADSKASVAQIRAVAASLNTAVSQLVSKPLSGEQATKPTVANPAVKVKLAQSQLRLVRGKGVKVGAGVYFKDGSSSYLGSATWKSSNPKVATVSSGGLVKAKKAGKVVITFTSKAKNAAGKQLSTEVTVTVAKAKPKAKLSKVTAKVPKTLRRGASVYVTGKYVSGKAAGVKVSYSSVRPDVAVVDSAGRIVGVSKGKDTIIVKAGKKTKRYTITVK